MSVKRSIFILLIAAVLVSGGPGAAIEPGRASAAPDPLAEQSAGSFKGRVVPGRWAVLAFPTYGRIETLLVEEGDQVSAGAALASLSGSRKLEAKIASRRLELLLARQAYADLQDQAAIQRAQAEQLFAQARKTRDLARSRVASLKKPATELTLGQARANILLIEQQLERAQRNLRKAEHFWKDKDNFRWKFVPQHPYKMRMVYLRRTIEVVQKRYDDAVDKYDDLLKPPDEIDVQQAEGELALAEAQMKWAADEIVALSHGLKVEADALAQARIRAAEAALAAAEQAYADTWIGAAFDGQVASVNNAAGEWIEQGEPVLVLADFSSWVVELDELKETEAPLLQSGQPVQIAFDALPDLTIPGKVESIRLINGEKDGEPTYLIRVTLLGNDLRLRWGMTARIKVSK